MTDTAVEVVGSAVRAIRTSLGWTQRRLAAEAGVSQAHVWAVEQGRVAHLTFDAAESLLKVMGAHLSMSVGAPFISDQRGQRDAAHTRMVAHVVRRLRRLGWEVLTEVGIGDGRSRGFIDILAFHPNTRVMLVIEIKTEIHDYGQIERSIDWYQRESWSIARLEGWQPERSIGVLLLLMTQANDDRVHSNREAFASGYPMRARDLQAIIDGDVPAVNRGHAVAMIDPLSRRDRWIRPLQVDGRRTTAPYPNYAGLMRAVEHADHAGRSGTAVASVAII